MTEKYHTETGLYVLCDSDGVVVAKADVPPGSHPVTDEADPSQSFDVEAKTDLENYSVGEPA
jgi:hypothetical protein